MEDFASPDVIFQMGLSPSRIDGITSIDGVNFDDAWSRRIEFDLDGVRVSVLGLDDLIVNKKAAGRPKDLLDVTILEKRRSEGR